MKALRIINFAAGLSACLCFAAFLTGLYVELGVEDANSGGPMYCLVVLGGLLGAGLSLAVGMITKHAMRQIAGCQSRRPFQDGMSRTDRHWDGSSEHSL